MRIGDGNKEQQNFLINSAQVGKEDIMYFILYYKDEELKVYAVSYRKPDSSKHWVQLPNGNWLDTRNPDKEFVEFIAVNSNNKAKFYKEFLNMSFRDNGYKKILMKNNMNCVRRRNIRLLQES